MIPEPENKVGAVEGHKETTDKAIFVHTPYKLEKWDAKKIEDSLVKETGIAQQTAHIIAHIIDRDIKNGKYGENVDTNFIRSLAYATLLDFGLHDYANKYRLLAIPLYDARDIIMNPNRENANIPHNPEATNLTLAETIKKQFMLSEVFSKEVAEAHALGDIHLHDLGFGDRPYCSGQNLAYLIKYGLSLPNAMNIARPAKHPHTLLAHMVKFSAALQGSFAGAIGWDAINIFFAPFLEGMSDKELHQLAQELIFEYSQQAVARGGQAIFSDLNFYWEIPRHFRDVDALGPGGVRTGKKYKDYQKEAQRFVWAIFDIYKDGDGTGRPFFFPKPLVHITEEFFRTEGHESFLEHICEVATKKGNTYFVFDRGETAKISECCRLGFKLNQSDLEDAKTPWKMRYTALQNVTLNLPRAAYKAKGDTDALFREIDRMMELAVSAHKSKKKFIEELLSMKEHGPLALLAMEKEKGEPYLRMNRASYLIGLLGLNELVQYHTGKQLHESEEAFDFGMKVINYMYLKTKQLSQREGMKFVMEQTPAESTSYRFAKLDFENFPESRKVIKGNQDTGNIYYTNSTQLNISAPLDYLTRIYLEGRYHDPIEAGAISHVWLGESEPPKESLANIVRKTFRNTRNAQIAFSPEFTTCNNCFRVHRGLEKTCSACGSDNVDYVTRVTGYFSKVSGWNKGKKAELVDRYKVTGNIEFNDIKARELPKDGIWVFGYEPVDGINQSCEKCEAVKDYFRKHQIPFVFYNINTLEGRMLLSELDLYGAAEKRIPVIIYRGQIVDGIDPHVKVAEAYMKEAGLTKAN